MTLWYHGTIVAWLFIAVHTSFAMEAARQLIASQTLQEHTAHRSLAIAVAGTVIGGTGLPHVAPAATRAFGPQRPGFD